MHAAEFRDLDYPAPVWRVHCPRIRRVHRQGKVRSPVVVVIEISGNDALEMTVIHNDDMIEAVAAQSSDESLHEWVLPWTSRCAEDLLDTHAMKPLLKRPTVDRVTISKQIFRRAVPWKSFNDLLGCPLRGRILSDVEVQNLPSRMCKHDQDEKQLESDRRYDEEVDRHQVIDLILSGTPSMSAMAPSSIAHGICPPLTSPR
jgi:hypothetical protein